MKLRGMIAASMCAICTFVLAGAAHAADVKVLGSTGVRDVVVALSADYERATGNKVVGTWTGTVDVLKRLQGGEVVDLVILSGPDLDNLIKQGKIVPGSRTPLLKSDIGACVAAGAPRPDIGTPEAVKRALLAAKSIGYSTGPSGVYLLGLFQRMGIADEMKAKAVVAPPGVAVGDLVARGEVGARLSPDQRAAAGGRHRLSRAAAGSNPGHDGIYGRHPHGRHTARSGRGADQVHHVTGSRSGDQEEGDGAGLIGDAVTSWRKDENDHASPCAVGRICHIQRIGRRAERQDHAARARTRASCARATARRSSRTRPACASSTTPASR